MSVRVAARCALFAALTLSLLAAGGPADAVADESADAKTPAAGAVAKKSPATKSPAKTAQKKDPTKVVRAARTRGAPRSLAEARRRLKSVRIDVEWKDTKFPRVVRYIGEMADFNVIVSPKLQAEALAGIDTITLKLRRVTLLQLTELVAKISGTSLKLQRGILQFTTKADARGKPTLRIYSIATLTAEIRNFPGPDLNLRPSGAEFEPEEETVVENSFSDPDRVADMIKEMVETESWEEDGVSISTNNNKLIVRQYPAVHRKIARFLAMLRAAR